MGKVILLAALAATLVLGGCASMGMGRQARPSISYGIVVPEGTKPAFSVEPCCRDLAAGRISLAQCMAKAECKAKGNDCCMNSIRDLPPANN